MAAPMKATEFMLNLQQRLITEKKVAESTANQYLQTLYKLNGGKGFTNMAWAKKVDDVQMIIDTYAPSTQQSQYGTLSSVLSLFADKSAYKKIYQYWREKLTSARKENEPTGEKSEKQEDNWLTWEEVEKKKSGLKEDVSQLISLKKLTPGQYEKLLNFVILSLYTDIAPRRNQDYLDMYVVKKLGKDYPKDKNYYEIAGKRFIFNKYKTAKTYGEQIVEVPEELQSALAGFIKHHPHNKEKEYKLLVKADGNVLNTVNAITRILNRIFEKNIGSSMLRHIYLTSKYGDSLKEMKEAARGMGHSVEQQRNYIMRDEE
jgi:integrase